MSYANQISQTFPEVAALNDAEQLIELSKQNWGKSAEISLAAATKALAIATASGNVIQQAQAIRHQAVAYWYLDDYEAVISNSQKALALFRSQNDKKGIAASLNTIATTQLNLERLNEAEETYLEALDIAIQIEDTSRQAVVLQNLGTVHIGLGELSDAEQYLEQSMILAKENENLFQQMHVLANLAGVYRRQSRHSENLVMLDELISLSRDSGNLARLGDALSDKGATFVLLERFNDAIALFEEALQVSVASNSKRTQMVTHEELGKLYEKIGNSDLALANYKEFHRLDSETRAESAQQAMAEFEVLLENEKQRALISEQQLKIEQSRVATLRIIAVSIFVSLVLIVFFIYNYHARRTEKLESNLMKDLIERKRGLFSDISHELRTPIAVLKLQIEGLEHHLIEDPEKTYKILHQKLASIDHLLSDISQLAMVDSGALKLNFENVELSTFFQDWYETVKVLPEQAGLQLVMQSDLATGKRIWMDPFRILQVLNNLLTNSVRYTDSPGRIEVSISIEEQLLYITLADTAPGLPEKQLALIFDRLFRAEASRDRHTGGSGLGLTICRGFIEAHRGSINAAQSELGGICIKITLPINESEEA